MSNYTQLPPGTLELLGRRVQRRLLPGDYSDWAGKALETGFDSHSLAILAGMDQATDPQEVAEYFLRAVKELKLSIPDCELAFGNWDQTDFVYRKLGLKLPDEWRVIEQHLVELVEQIKAGILEPVTGLERITREVSIYQYRDAADGVDWAILNRGGQPQSAHRSVDAWAWDELADYISYDDFSGRFKEPGSELIDQEIREFAIAWLADKQVKFNPRVAIRELLPESEWRKVVPAPPAAAPDPQPSVVAPLPSTRPTIEPQRPVAIQHEPAHAASQPSEPTEPHDDLAGHSIRIVVMLVLMALFFTGLWSLRNSISPGIGVVAIVLGLAVTAAVADKVAEALGFFQKKP